MKTKQKKLHLGAFFHATGHHVVAWMDQSSQADAGLNFSHYVQLAKTAEAAHFDMIFLADALMVKPGAPDVVSRVARYTALFEPLTLLSAIGAVTSRIGLVATATSTYNEPYHVARKFASLDQISGGRAGWNLVTSANAAEADNFGSSKHPPHHTRYERAREFADVVLGLWDSWDDDAFLFDKKSGRLFEPTKLHELNHVGENFSVRGPLNIARSPQGRPVVVQAGSSEAGRRLAADTADVVFTAETDLQRAQAFYADLKGRLAAAGRKPDDLKIMPGAYVIVGKTLEVAQEKRDRLDRAMPLPVALSNLSEMLGGVDLSGMALDEPLPDLPTTNGGKGRFEVVVELARRENFTLRQLSTAISGARGHLSIVGTPSDVADVFELWLNGNAADGFNVMPATLPGGFDDFCELVIPELVRRGLFRQDYEGTTLRDHLGLPFPETRYAKKLKALPGRVH